jgi:YgiT-type zinc finger domain-containing protein
VLWTQEWKSLAMLAPDQQPEKDKYETLCQECKAGAMRLQYITYFTWLDQELVMVPNFPAWVCDMCGRREYDSRAINWLNMLLNPSAGRKKSPRKKGGSPRVNRIQP